MFTVRRILLIGLLAASATGCAVAPYESHVVHEVYDPYPYVYPRTQVHVYQSYNYGHRHHRYDHADRERPHADKPNRREDRSDRRREHARDAKHVKRDVARPQPHRDVKEHSARQERAERRRDVDRPLQARNDSRDHDRRERR